MELLTNPENKSIWSSINYAHPITKDMKLCYLFNEDGGGTLRDLTDNKNKGFLEGGAIRSKSKYKYSSGVLLNGASSMDIINCGNPTFVNHDAPFTFFWRGFIKSQGSNNGARFFNRNQADGTAINFQMQTNFALEFDVSPTYQKVTETGLFSNESYCSIALTFDGTLANAGSHIYVNSKEPNYVTLINGTVSKNNYSGNLYLGNRVSDFLRAFDGVFNQTIFWNRVLSSGEIVILHSNPYCFLYSPPIQFCFIQSPLAETLIDNFDDNVIDPTKWVEHENGLNTVTEVNQQLEFDTNVVGGNAYLTSLNYYDLRSSFIKIKVANAGDQTLTSLDVVPLQFGDLVGENVVGFDISGNTIKAEYAINALYTTVASDTYNSTNHTWLRIRESGGTTFWEISSNGTSWNSFASVANPVALDDGQILLYVLSGIELATTKVIYDNFNVAPSATTVFRRTLSGLGTRTGSRQVHRWSE